ncbi:hypothetical protein AGLY_005344 [Aphis glycines]|uniref:Uncharacterized protein n=1 Tax=Aphis glycines TaxID=307491 RepID=A0A6G0TWJ2_APHGL|nr:hypothetical protein AGLY_005344 [Aphis glycines]
MACTFKSLIRCVRSLPSHSSVTMIRSFDLFIGYYFQVPSVQPDCFAFFQVGQYFRHGFIHPRALARSLPVPNGSTPTGNDTALAIWSKIDSTHPTVPSPPHANTRRFGTFLYSSKPILGPPLLRSNTCLGFRCHWNFCSSFTPWLPPDFGFINIITGLTFTVGIGFITNSLSSLSGCKIR